MLGYKLDGKSMGTRIKYIPEAHHAPDKALGISLNTTSDATAQ